MTVIANDKLKILTISAEMVIIAIKDSLCK